MNRLTISVLLGGTLAMGANALATDFTYVGPAAGDFGTVANWVYWSGSGNSAATVLPGASDNAIMDTTSPLYSAVDGTTMTLGEMSIARYAGENGSFTMSGGTLGTTASGGNGFIYVGSAGNGTLNMQGGTLNVGSNVRISACSTAGQATNANLIMTGGVINITGGLEVPASAWSDSARVAHVELDGGTINISGLGGLSLQAGDGTYGSLNITGGTLDLQAGVGAGSWVLTELQNWVTAGHLTAYGVANWQNQNQARIVFTQNPQTGELLVTAVSVPEPASLPLAGLGGALLLHRRRRPA